MIACFCTASWAFDVAKPNTVFPPREWIIALRSFSSMETLLE